MNEVMCIPLPYLPLIGAALGASLAVYHFLVDQEYIRDFINE